MMTLDDGLINNYRSTYASDKYRKIFTFWSFNLKKGRRLKKEKENNNDSPSLRRWRRCFVLNNNWIREISILVWTLTTISHFQFPNPYSPFRILRFSSIHFTYRTFRSGFAIITSFNSPNTLFCSFIAKLSSPLKKYAKIIAKFFF